jgi:hypothetical protein
MEGTLELIVSYNLELIKMLKMIDSIPLPIFITLSVFLGLAPFFPEPHLFEKIRMLQNGELQKLIDIFDLLLHVTPWGLLLIKLSMVIKSRQAVSELES